jgi:beta-aspartyl-peptidase (threonine type)
MRDSGKPGRFVTALQVLVGVGVVAGLWWAVSVWKDAVSRAEAKEQVKAVLDEQVAAWNAGTLERFMATYWQSEELVFFSGNTVTKGYKAVAERYRKNYQANGKEMGQLTFSDVEVTVLTADMALARARWKVVTTRETIDGLFTLWLRRLPEGWKIVYDHTSKADPPKPA